MGGNKKPPQYHHGTGAVHFSMESYTYHKNSSFPHNDVLTKPPFNRHIFWNVLTKWGFRVHISWFFPNVSSCYPHKANDHIPNGGKMVCLKFD